MRSEKEMMTLILDIARNNENIRAVYMNGSRANPNVKKDQYRDFDIVYVVKEVFSLSQDKSFPEQFGKPLIIQEPSTEDPNNHYTWLMLFEDGVRIDLQVKKVEASGINEDSLTVPLLDKDGIFPEIAASNDSDYWIKKPTQEEFKKVCNNFWWCLNNTVKGIARKQLPYAMRMYMETSHRELEQMVDWFIAVENEFKVTTGMWGKYVEEYLSHEIYERYEKTYPQGNYQSLWQAIDEACELFSLLAKETARHIEFTYVQSEEEGMKRYLKKMRNEIE